MFQTNQGPSFPAHQFLFSGTSAPVYDDGETGTPWQWFSAENPPAGTTQAGCAAAANTMVPDLDAGGNTQYYNPPYFTSNAGFPCYNHDTIVDVLNKGKGQAQNGGISWKYYTDDPYSIWTAPNAIDLLCNPSPVNPNGGTCTNTSVFGTNGNVVHPSQTVLTDIANCNLAQVTWVTPNGNWSDHPGYNNDINKTLTYGLGASWVADIIDAVGQSYANSNKKCDYWGSAQVAGVSQPTAILVTWDDWGGWADHVAPPLVNSGGLGYYNSSGAQYVYGFRVPLLVVSAYGSAPNTGGTGYVSGPVPSGTNPLPTACPGPPYCHDFGSILNFVEYVFGTGSNSLGAIPQPTNAPPYPYADALALDSFPAPGCTQMSCPYSLSDFFNFKLTTPNAFVPISSFVPASYFTSYNGPLEDPDDDMEETQ